MSEEQFKSARSELAMSQSVTDQFRGSQMPPQGQEMPQDAQQPSDPTQQPQGAPQQPELAQTIKEVVQPMFDDMKNLFKKEEKQVELKIDGQMTPVDNNPA